MHFMMFWRIMSLFISTSIVSVEMNDLPSLLYALCGIDADFFFYLHYPYSQVLDACDLRPASFDSMRTVVSLRLTYHLSHVFVHLTTICSISCGITQALHCQLIHFSLATKSCRQISHALIFVAYCRILSVSIWTPSHSLDGCRDFPFRILSLIERLVLCKSICKSASQLACTWVHASCPWR